MWKDRVEVEWTDPDYNDEVKIVVDYKLDPGQLEVRKDVLVGTLLRVLRDLKGAPGVVIKQGHAYTLDGEELFEEAKLVEETKGLATKINVVKVEDSYLVGDDDVDDSPLV